MVFKTLYVIVLWTKKALALEGLMKLEGMVKSETHKDNKKVFAEADLFH